MAKQLLYDENARQALMNGAEKVAAAVRVTLGPKGRNVVLGKKFGKDIVDKNVMAMERAYKEVRS